MKKKIKDLTFEDSVTKPIFVNNSPFLIQTIGENIVGSKTYFLEREVEVNE